MRTSGKFSFSSFGVFSFWVWLWDNFEEVLYKQLSEWGCCVMSLALPAFSLSVSLGSLMLFDMQILGGSKPSERDWLGVDSCHNNKLLHVCFSSDVIFSKITEIHDYLSLSKSLSCEDYLSCHIEKFIMLITIYKIPLHFDSLLSSFLNMNFVACL